MEQVTITITRLFDVQRIPSSRFNSQHTRFGFEAKGIKKPFVPAPGWPRLEVGDTLHVLLDEAGNWQSLLGWKNITTGEEVCSSVTKNALWFAISLFIAALPVFFWFAEQANTMFPFWVALWAIIVFFVAILRLKMFLKAIKVKQWFMSLSPS